MKLDAATQNQIADLLREDRRFPPDAAFAAQANLRDADLHAHAAADPEAFWAEQARALPWSEPFHTTLEWNPPHAKWFLGGRMNLAHNCLDWQIAQGRRNKAAIIWEGEPGDVRTYTYGQLHREVCQFANALRHYGVGHGDRVAIYLPMMPEAVVAMLACARIGAVHTVVFGGFSAEALADRINDCQCKLVVTADGGWRRGNVLTLKHTVDEALKHCPSVQSVIVVKRPHGEPFPTHIQEGRDHWYHRAMQGASPHCPAHANDAEDMLFILYTSGTTGKPKGIVHTTGGYAVQTRFTMHATFDLKDQDVFFCTADVGWVTGHSYLVYGPLQCGATVLMYEGAPDYPARDRFWELVAKHHATILYTAPTAIRAFMKWGTEHPARHDLSSLRLVGTVGEPINPEAWVWYHRYIGGGRCPVVDTWWQTETGAHMITGLPGITTMRPGYAGPAIPGVDIAVVDNDGNEVESGSGLLVIRKPWPGMLRTLYGDDARYREVYWSRFGGRFYFAGDGAKRDAEGNFMILGRVDDVLNVSGHRLGTMEVESALVDHPAVAEAAVVGRHHDLKGQCIVAFVTLRAGNEAGSELRDELREPVAKKIGSIARPDDVLFSADLPKTRSGKIMRRLLRDIAEGRALGDVTTLADPGVVQSLRERYEEKEGG
ncbi:MAG: acetate--CoA ligase [Candidatus Sumerlaeia bacterium]|nr:acetate--CoA ligase [Candidatus Sumerlaeia bacterium]